MEKKTGKKSKAKKTTNEKPISLHPLKPEDVLRKLLEVPPEKKK